MIVTPLGDSTVWPATLSSQLPPSADAAMSTITDPDFIRATASAVTSTGGLRPGTWAVVITTSIPPMTSLSSACWATRSSGVNSRA